ncbi:MAG TPA: peptide chain release factor 1 [Oligoflexus sp.]|uniref:peptide chain release factor 1 n=1 Tax=Oligoflexus sp. TaxID=1971216 RepID=UPI002D7EBF62|nr:peptide chain release factor 1 [Oligoflexus sp.]HET9240487.1 peptide chain release factor 1 [Oligoflexus sp.]
MYDKLESIEFRFVEIDSLMSRDGLSGAEITKLSRERAGYAEIIAAYREYKKLKSDRDAAKLMLNEEPDAELRAMAKEELETLELRLVEVEKELQILTLPKDPNDDRNVIVEVRAGTGGEEASLFAADLLRMYTRFADKCGWKTELMSVTESATGGYKEAIILIKGDKVYRRLKFESGVHRVQRVPATEAQGRIHTSACTVAILPEADEVDDVPIDSKDLEITLCRSSGAGGQHVNTTDSAVRILHKPSGLVVECQDERSQIKNREKAMKVLRSRLLEKAQKEQADAISADRKSQVGSGDRSERIRTYNFPQSRVTDHRINLTLYKLSEVMEGDLAEIVDALAAYHQTELLKNELDKVQGVS